MRLEPAAPARPTVRSVFSLAFAGLLLIQSAWMLALPMFRGPDEIDHLLRSSDVALGHWQPAARDPDQDQRYVIADGTLAHAAQPTCELLHEDFDTTVCRPRRSLPDGTVEILSHAARYNAAYYLVVGSPMRVENSESGAWAVRALGALLSALLMAWAWSLVVSRQATAWPSLAMMIATTPAVFFATTVAAPNGVGYAAGILLWAGLLTAARDRWSSSAPIAGAVGACTLVLTHPTGIVWVGASVLTVMVLSGWSGLKRLLSQRPRTWFGSTAAVVFAMAGAVAWNYIFQPNAFNPAAVADAPAPLVAETKAIPMVAHAVLWVCQTIGVMPNRFGLLWLAIYPLWLAPLAFVLLRAGRAATGRERAAGSAALAIAVLVPAVATVTTYETLGVSWQGRYELPLLVGIVMLGGAVLDRGAEIRRSLRVPLIVLLALTQYMCVLCLGLREARGPFDDGRPWALVLWVAVPALLGAGYMLLARASGVTSVQTE